MRISRKTLILIAFLAFLVGALSVWKIFLAKPKKEIPSVSKPTSTPIPVVTPTSGFSPKEKIISLLPITTENYTIQYLPVPKKFLVLILKNPFEEYKTEVEEWFRSQGIDPGDPSISWGSARGVAPKSP